MDKFEKLYNKVIEIIEWAESEGHLTEDATTVLIRNIGEAKDDIDNE